MRFSTSHAFKNNYVRKGRLFASLNPTNNFVSNAIAMQENPLIRIFCTSHALSLFTYFSLSLQLLIFFRFSLLFLGLRKNIALVVTCKRIRV